MIKKLIAKFWKFTSYESFMAGVECGKLEITEGPLIVAEPLEVGETATYKKGGYLYRRNGRVGAKQSKKSVV